MGSVAADGDLTSRKELKTADSSVATAYCVAVHGRTPRDIDYNQSAM